MSKTSVLRMAGSESHGAINGTKRILGGLVLAAALSLHHNATAGTAVPLGSDVNFAVLAGSSVTSTGNTVINGNLGEFPGTSVTGIAGIAPGGPGIVNGTIYAGGTATGVSGTAESDLATAFNDAKGLASTANLTGQNLGGMTLLPGVYTFSSTAFLTTGNMNLMLNGNGEADPQFVFQIGTGLTTASSSEVLLENGALAGDVFWEVGSSATLGSGSEFVGNILAYASISAGTTATVDGRLLAENGAVTLAGADTISMPIANAGPGGPPSSAPDTGSTLLLLGSALVALIAFGRRFSVLA